MRRILLAAVISAIILLAGCTPGKDAGAADAVRLREQYPEYFGLPDLKGLEVYVCSFAEDQYSFRITPGTNRDKTVQELMELPGLTAEETAAILETYGTPDTDIFIIPWQNPLSDYFYGNSAEYAAGVSALFGDRYSVMPLTVPGPDTAPSEQE